MHRTIISNLPGGLKRHDIYKQMKRGISQVRRVKALRTGNKRPRHESEEEAATAAEEENTGGGLSGKETDDEVASAAAKAKRGTRRKNKERKVL